MPDFQITRGDDVFKITAPDEATASKAAQEYFAIMDTPETTVADVGTGIKSGITTGAIAALPSIPALAYDVVDAPGKLFYRAADKVAGALGYDKHYEENLAPGGLFAATRAVGDFATETADKFVDAPVSSGGKITRALTSAGVEALGGSGVFKVVGLTGRFFTNYDDAVKAAQAIGVTPAKAIQQVNEAGIEALAKAPVANAAYSAAAGAGGEIAQQNDVNPVVGSLLGVAAAATGHATVPLAKAGVKSVLDETLSRTEDIQHRKVADVLRGKATDKLALKEWAQRAQESEDAYQAEFAKGADADQGALQTLDAARREAHGELVRNSQPTLFEATDDKGIGKLERNMRNANTAEFGISNEIRREQQNAARLAEIESLGGEGRQAALLEEFRKQRAEMDAGHAQTEAGRQAAADAAAARAGTGETAEAVGERIRTPVVAQEAAVRQEGTRLYGLVAKEGVTVGTGRVKAAVGEHFRESLEKPLSPTEKYYADLVRGYGGRLDFQRMQDLRSAILSKLREELTDIEASRYTKLQTAIDEAMDDGLAKAIKDDPNLFRRVGDALTAEGLPAKEGVEDAATVEARRAADRLYEEERAMRERTGMPPPPPRPGAADVPFEGGGRAVVPVDDAVTEAQRRANQYWKEQVKQPFEVQPVAPVVQRQRQSASGFKMTEAAIPEAVFRPGNTGGEKIRAMRAAGATDAALSEAAALSFQQRVVRDGSVSPDTFRKWVRDHQAALNELPDSVRQRFTSAYGASMELERVATARQAAQRAFDESAVGDVLGIAPQNLTKEIGAALRDRAAAEELAARAAGNAPAQAGLRRLVADHLLFQFKDASNNLSKAALSTFLDRNMPQMAAIFGDEGARRFKRLIDDIERSRKAQVTGKDPAGPGTAGDLAALAKGSVFDIAISSLSPKAALIGGAVKIIGNALKTSGMQEIDKLLAKALLDPNLARQLLTKAPALKNEKFLRGLVRSIAKPAVLGMAYGGNQ